MKLLFLVAVSIMVGILGCDTDGVGADVSNDKSYLSRESPGNAFIQSYEHNPRTGSLKVYFNHPPIQVVATSATQRTGYRKRVDGRLVIFLGVACSNHVNSVRIKWDSGDQLILLPECQ